MCRAAGARAVQAVFAAALVGAWFLASRHGRVNPLLLPDPVAVAREFADIVRSGEFVPDLLVTLGELAAAFALASAAGLVIGYLVSRSAFLVRAYEPLLAGFYAVPIILFLPLYVLAFGLGPASKIALGVSIAFFPIALATIAGFANVEPVLIRAAHAMGASDYLLFRHVLLPAALPVVLGGLRIGFTVALLSIVGGEALASLAGLGHRIVQLAEGMDIARMFAYIVFVVAMVAALNALVSRIEARAGRTS